MIPPNKVMHPTALRTAGDGQGVRRSRLWLACYGRQFLTNIFMLPEGLADEDRFTAQLHYLIECIPAVGQGMVDVLLAASGRPATRFKHSEDHPGTDRENRPDFLLACEDFDIVCEHKLQSPLGVRQLERYLAMHWPRETHLALITNTPSVVSDEVRIDPRYLSPRKASHYLWSDLYPMLSVSDSRIALDFAAYMRSRGMKPLELANGWGALFEDRSTAETFGEQFRRVRSYFADQGCKCALNADRRGFQVSRPLPWLHLLYLFVDPANKSHTPGIDAAVLGARIYIRADAAELPAFSNNEPSLAFGSHQVHGYAKSRAAPWNPELRLVYEYVAPLLPVLSDDAVAIQISLLEFAKGAVEHSQTLVREPR